MQNKEKTSSKEKSKIVISKVRRKGFSFIEFAESSEYIVYLKSVGLWNDEENDNNE